MTRPHIDEVEKAKKIDKIATTLGDVWVWFLGLVTVGFLLWLIWWMCMYNLVIMCIVVGTIVLLGGGIWWGTTVETARETLEDAKKYGVRDD
jgi:hypothetical protein